LILDLPDSLVPVFWVAAGTGLLALISLPIGISLLTGTGAQRNVGLPLTWISAGFLVASAAALLLLLGHKM
jgi:hypothetical protein